MRKRRAPFIALVVMVAAVALVSSAGGVTSSGAQAVTLTYVDDIYGDPVSVKAQQAMIASFEKQNPNVKIKYVFKPFGQWVGTAKLALQGSGAPDVLICAAYDTCNAALVKAGLVIPQEKYAKQYKWFTGIPAELVRESRHERDGTTFRGQSYGPAQTYDLVGWYYNKAKLREIGVGVPKTQAQFEQALAKAKAAGETPIIYGDLAKVDLGYTFMQQLAYEAAPGVLRTWMYRTGSPDLTGAITRAAGKLKRWYDAGYFNKDIFGVDQYTAITRFNKGEGVFISTGAWWTGLLTDLGKDAGYMLPPPKKVGDGPRAIFSLSNPLLISSKSKNPDTAAKFVAWLVNPKTARVRAKYGLAATPISAVKVSDAPGSTYRDVLQAMKTMNTKGQPLPWLDPSPRMLLEIYGAGLQAVLGGKKSVADFAKEVTAEQRAQYQERKKKGYG
jgi:raffinose/stachyose/melibiose transport system substrate-binding protein